MEFNTFLLQMVDDLSYRGYQKHPIHMDPPTEYADMLMGHAQVLPLPVSDALDRRAPELPLINNVQQQSSRVSKLLKHSF